MPPAWWPVWLPPRPWRIGGTAPDPDLVPDRLSRRTAFLVERPSGPAWLVLDCPCRTGHRMMLSLSGARNPKWTVNKNAPRLDVAPSIDSFHDGRRCHFWLRDGRVRWVPEAAGAGRSSGR